MAEPFLKLPPEDRLEALTVAAGSSGRPTHLLEKDVWVVWALATLFSSAVGEHLIFKGGTALSKVYSAIRRFSEDVDLTYDIRAIAPDLVKDSPDAIPSTPSQERRWTKEIRKRLTPWVEGQVLPLVQGALTVDGLSARASATGEKIFIEYEALARGSGYVRPTVMLEFGARSTGEPAEVHRVVCDSAAYLTSLEFPEASPRVMRAERTFWEKATAIHVFCAQGHFRGGDHFARHWHDIARLDDAGYVDAAFADRPLARAVSEHKRMFFAEKDAGGQWIDYHAAVSGSLKLVPEGAAREALARDYDRMIKDGLLLDDPEPFDALLDRCRAIQGRANEVGRRESAG